MAEQYCATDDLLDDGMVRSNSRHVILMMRERCSEKHQVLSMVSRYYKVLRSVALLQSQTCVKCMNPSCSVIASQSSRICSGCA